MSVQKPNWVTFFTTLSECGIIKQAAIAAHIPSTTVSGRRQHDPAFGRLIDKLKRPQTPQNVSDSAWERFILKLAEEGCRVSRIFRLPGMPPQDAYRKRMRCDPAFYAQVSALIGSRRPRRVPDVVWDQLLSCLAKGQALKPACRQPGMPDETSVRDRIKKDPDFAAKFQAVYVPRRRAAVVPVADRRGAPTAEARNRNLLQNSLYATASAAVSSSLPDHIRDDVISEIVLAVLVGDIGLDDVKANACRFMAAYYKMHPVKYAPTSLDAPAYRDGGRDTIGDTVSVGLWAA